MREEERGSEWGSWREGVGESEGEGEQWGKEKMFAHYYLQPQSHWDQLFRGTWGKTESKREREREREADAGIDS